jgi:cyclophilin family peptidyl-prolyl cis-trans isomerase
MKGTVAFSSQMVDGKLVASSSFYISMGDTESLDGKHGIFGTVAEGLDVLDKINLTLCDDKQRPFIDIQLPIKLNLESYIQLF